MTGPLVPVNCSTEGHYSLSYEVRAFEERDRAVSYLRMQQPREHFLAFHAGCEGSKSRRS